MNYKIEVYAYDDETYDLYVEDEYIETFDFYDRKMKRLNYMNKILATNYNVEQMQNYLLENYFKVS